MKKNLMQFEIDNLLVVGNGFDMDLGLRTSYSSFIESNEWKKMSNERKQEYPNPSLIDFVKNEYEASKGGWFDLENAMLSYVMPKDGTYHVNNVVEDKKDYDAICTSLVEYLCNLFWNPSPLKVVQRMHKSFAADLLYRFCDPLLMSVRNVMYTFNYTPIDVIYSSIGGLPTTIEYHNIHGEISEKDFHNKTYNGSSIILGIMSESPNLIAPGYSFLVKSNHPKYFTTSIEDDLIRARNVYIFGHSLNKIDFQYFKTYFEYIEMNCDGRDLYIVTKDEESGKNIIRNIVENGVSLDRVKNNCNFHFCYTNKFENK